ncbi:MAG: HAD-IA family hydrolase [Bryobacteraceae bacterium]
MADAWLQPGIALVFDMDGVVVDSNPLHTEAWNQYNRRHGIDAGAGMAQRMYGKRNDQIVRDFFGEGLTDYEVAAHGSAKEELYRQMMGPQLAQSLVPGVRELLERHRGLPVALATNAEPANVDFVLDGSGLRLYFRVIVDGHQVTNPKPHPEIYLQAARLLGIAGIVSSWRIRFRDCGGARLGRARNRCAHNARGFARRRPGHR